MTGTCRIAAAVAALAAAASAPAAASAATAKPQEPCQDGCHASLTLAPGRAVQWASRESFAADAKIVVNVFISGRHLRGAAVGRALAYRTGSASVVVIPSAGRGPIRAQAAAYRPGRPVRAVIFYRTAA